MGTRTINAIFTIRMILERANIEGCAIMHYRLRKSIWQEVQAKDLFKLSEFLE